MTREPGMVTAIGGASESVRVPPALLATLRVATGRSAAPGSHGTALAETGARSWLEALETAARVSGLAVRSMELGSRDALRTARSDVPLVTWSEASGWVVLIRDRRGRPALATGPGERQRVDRRELTDLLGQTGDGPADPRTWLAVRAGLAPEHDEVGEAPTPFARLLEILRPERGDVLAIILYAVFIGLLTLTIPIAVQQLVNTVAFGGLVQPVVVLALLLFLGLGFAACLSTFQSYLAEILQRRIFVRACVDLAERLPRVEPDAFDGYHGPERVNRFFDLITLQKTGARLLLEGSAVLLQTATGLLILSFYHPLMLALSLLLVAAMALVVFGFGRGATGSALRESHAKYELAAWMEELARHGAAFRGRAGRIQSNDRADVLATRWVEARRAHYRIVLRQLIAALALQAVVNTLVLALGGFLVVNGELTLGQLVASEIIVSAVVAAFARLGKQLESAYDLLAAVDKLGSLFDLPTERVTGRILRSGPEAAALSAEGLGYARDGQTILEGVDLRIEGGERVALVGPPASGKTTLVDLLCGQREPDRGHVELDGNDLRELDLAIVRDQIVCVQQPEVFAGTVLENLCIGRLETTAEEVNAVLRRLDLLEELRRLPEGLQSPLSTNGTPLSRSQIARLMIARAMLTRPRLLIVDGELAMLERAQRRVALDALFDPDAPWTLLVVSSEADLIERCDRTIELTRPERPAAIEQEKAARSQGPVSLREVST